MNKRELDFVTFCIARLALTLNMAQKDVYNKLYTSGILYD